MNFTVYKSSAGSGKTFTLVKAYLRIALSDPFNPPQLYRHILAITFTNKAAAEMKERVISALKELSENKAGELSPMAKALTEELKLDAFTLSQRAERTLRAILHNYTDFSISTIDSFVHRIVRTFAHDLHLPMNFEVETDADRIIHEAVDVLISRIGEDEELTNLLVSFSESKTQEDKTWQVDEELRSIAKHLLSEEGSQYAQKLRHLSIADFTAIRKVLLELNDTFRKTVQETAASAVLKIKSAGLDETDFGYGKNGIAGRLRALASGDIEKLGASTVNIDKTISSGKWSSGKAAASAKKTIEGLQPELEAAWNKLVELKEKHFSRYIVRKMILDNLHALAVLNEIEKIIFSFRNDENLIHISEFNRMIARIVSDEPAPFIYERLGEKYTNYLIDEFQDTSGMQWQNLLPLVENALAGNNFTMLVGDGKQSIYRWRGGEVEQFAALPAVRNDDKSELVTQRAQSLERNYREEFLTKNYRSAKEVIGFNNNFFSALSETLGDDYRIIYKNLQQEYDEKKSGGYVRIEFAGESDGEDAILQRTAILVNELVARGWNFNDIAILTRKNDEASAIASTLLESGVQVLSAESLLLKQSPVVSFLVALLYNIEHPNDELSATEVMGWLVAAKKTKLSLHALMEKFHALDKSVEAVFIAEGFQLQFAQLARQPLYERCEALLRAFHLDQNADAYILFFLDEILSWSGSRNAAQEDFFSWWTDRSKKASVVVPEGMNAVNVMTIHKAKGLEFPVVILPYANWKVKNQKDEFWIDPADEAIPALNAALVNANEKLRDTPFAKLYEDEKDKSFLDLLNELYVAMTRPEKELYVLTGVRKETELPLKSVTACIAFALEKMGIPGEENIFEAGTPFEIKEKKTFPVACIRPDRLSSLPWQNRLRIRYHSQKLWDAEDASEKRNRGLLIHELLSGIETAADIPRCVQTSIAAGKVTVGMENELIALLERITTHEKLANCFEKNAVVHREKEILLPGGTRYRPDRVVENKNEVIVLDYKTGIKKNEHRTQVDHYAEALSAMGYSNISKKIFYTETEEVDEW